MNNELSDYQKGRLSKSKHIEKITENHVVFTSEFKQLVVEASFKGMTPDEFFTQEGIKINYFKPGYANSCLKRWKKKYLEDGREALKVDGRGSNSPGRPKTEGLTYEELEEIVRIQQ